MADLDAESFFDYEEDNKYICYVITTDIELEKYSDVLKSHQIRHMIIDISHSILSSEIDIENETVSKIDETNSYKYDFFISYKLKIINYMSRIYGSAGTESDTQDYKYENERYLLSIIKAQLGLTDSDMYHPDIVKARVRDVNIDKVLN